MTTVYPAGLPVSENTLRSHFIFKLCMERDLSSEAAAVTYNILLVNNLDKSTLTVKDEFWLLMAYDMYNDEPHLFEGSIVKDSIIENKDEILRYYDRNVEYINDVCKKIKREERKRNLLYLVKKIFCGIFK